jgi:hypothetical protein
MSLRLHLTIVFLHPHRLNLWWTQKHLQQLHFWNDCLSNQRNRLDYHYYNNCLAYGANVIGLFENVTEARF